MASAIEISGVTKRSAGCAPSRTSPSRSAAGRVTGFLGPNGAGKSTTLRVLLGLIARKPAPRPSPGGATRSCLIERTGRRRARRRELHPGRSGPQPLRVFAAGAAPAGAAGRRARAGRPEASAADRRVKGYSMGMRERLAIAAALLGDPEVLILDEPVNGLDPPGIRWIRGLLRAEAARGRAVLVSSHLLSEVAQSVDDVVVISHGVLRASGPLAQVLGSPDGELTRVRSADAQRLAGLLRERGITVSRTAPAHRQGSDRMIGAVARKFFGSSNDRRVRKYQPRVDAINALEPELSKLSDEELRARTAQFKKELAEGTSLDDLLVPAFATVREAAKRTHRPAPFRRAVDRRHDPARGPHLRDEDRRRQDAGRDLAGLSERARQPRRPRRHRQRLSRQARRRMDGADLQVSRADCRRDRARARRRGAQEAIRLRRYLRHQQRARLRLSARQHEVPAGGHGPARARLRHRRRGRLRS